MPPLPPVTKALMLICVAVFCLSELLGQFGVFAMTGAGPFPLLDAWFGLWPLRSGSFWPWQVLTYAFLHGGVMHLFFNMLGLWMFGAELERLWGPKRYLHLLLASVLAAAVVQLVFTLLVGSRGPTVGASGGLYGLLLAYALAFRNRQFDLLGLAPMLLMLLPIPGADILGMMLFIVLLTNRQLVPVRPILVRSMAMVAVFGGVELFNGVFFNRSSGVAHFAHLGGMLGAWLVIQYWRGRLPLGGGPRRR